MTIAEQYLLELINRARLDPLAEAARQGIGLDDGLSPGTIGAGAKQALAPDALLDQAATSHSLWMLATDTFSHTGANGSAPWDRATALGYGYSTMGENISWRGTSAPVIDLPAQIDGHHRSLFLSAGHRENILNPAFREVGLAQEGGTFFSGTRDWTASMLTELFGTSGARTHVTGVVIADADGDGFYDMGEGQAGATFTAGGASATTGAPGGYAVAVARTAATAVSGTHDGTSFALTIDTSDGNAKLDLVTDAGGTWAQTDSTLALISGLAQARLIGIEGAALTGTAAANHLIGNAAANRLSGWGGNDRLKGGEGADTLAGGQGADTLWGEAGNDVLLGGEGSDVLMGGAGRDTLAGEGGNDWLHGGGWGDRFVFRAGCGTDTVADFSAAAGDRLALDDALWAGEALSRAQVVDRFAEQAGADVMFDFGPGEVVILKGATLAALVGAIDLI